MPEIPELEHVSGLLCERLAGRRVARVEVSRPIVIRAPREEFEAGLTGAALADVRRTGKFLLFDWDRGTTMAVAPMLTGRFQWTQDAKAHARTCFTLHFEGEDGEEELAIRYIDERFLGKVYLAPSERLDTVPVLCEQGPDALDAGLTEEVFLERLRRYRGQVKNVLVNAKFVAGIGNAYVDEILFEAAVHPFTAVKELSAERRAAVYRAMGRRAGLGVRARSGGDGRADRREAARVSAGASEGRGAVSALRRGDFGGVAEPADYVVSSGVPAALGRAGLGEPRLAGGGEELVGTGEEGAPGGAALEVAEVDLGEAGFGAGRLGAEAHAGFVGRAAAFAAVAGGAGGDQVFPGVAAAAGAGDDMVEREVGSGRAAVLAGVAGRGRRLRGARGGPWGGGGG